MALRIPKADQGVLAQLLALSETQRASVLDGLRSADASVGPAKLAAVVAHAAHVPSGLGESFVRVLATIHSICLQRDWEVEEMVKQIEESLSHPPPEGWTIARQFLSDLLSTHAIAKSSKSLDLLFQHPRILTNSRLITDFRPVFDASATSPPSGTVICHQLKLTYQEVGGAKEIFLSLDLEDIEKLLRSLARAKEKDQSLRVFAAKNGMAVLNPSDIP
jgi:hypothetical protein